MTYMATEAIDERHRHRYEVNNTLLPQTEKEIIESNSIICQ